MMKTKLFSVMFGILLLATLAGAFAPPSPFPVVAQVIMGGDKVQDQRIVVSILDSENGAVIDSDEFFTDTEGRVLLDMSNFRGCTTYDRDRICYAGVSRSYAGDDLEFVTVWDGFSYTEVRGIASLGLRIGVDPKSQYVIIRDDKARPQVIEKIVEVEKEVVVEKEVEKEVIKEVVVEKEVTVYKCSDGSEVEAAEDCEEGGISDTIYQSVLALAGLVLGALGVQWHRGLLGLSNYYWQKGERMRALRILLTVTKRARAGYYKKK